MWSYLDDKFRQRSLLLLSKICKAHGTMPTSYLLRPEVIYIERSRYRGGFADVYSGKCLGFPVAIKCLRMYMWDSDRTFKVRPIVLMHHLYPSSIQRLCREVVGWKHLSHPNVLPLIGISVLANPRCFLILTEWMPNGNVMQYARSNPRANRLRLVSSPPQPNIILFLLATLELSEVMSGVAHLHKLRIVHGDLKGVSTPFSTPPSTD